MKSKNNNEKGRLQDIAEGIAKEIGVKTEKAIAQVKGATSYSKDALVKALDANGNGQVDIEDIILIGMRVPGVYVDRAAFLQKEFLRYHSQNVIDEIIQFNPAHAGISMEEIDKIADEIIKYECNCVSGISAVLGMPGGVTMFATIPTDLAQYYGFMLRATQKLLYLYGFPQLELNESTQMLDSETMNILIVCMGVMYGVQGANAALKAMAAALGRGVEKQLLKMALTKGTIYPIVKSISKWFGVKMTKDVFAGFFRKAIPVVGGALGGGITYITFKPCCNKLKESLEDTYLSNPGEKNANAQVKDVEFIELR